MWKCQQSIDNFEHTVVYTMQTVKIVLTVYVLAKFDTSYYLPWAGVNRLLNIQGSRNRGSCVIKRWLRNSCLSHVLHITCTLGNICLWSIVCRKNAEAIQKMIMMFNPTVNACQAHGMLYVRLYRTLFLQCANFMYTLITVTSLSNNFAIT